VEYPFAALVGQEQLRMALLLGAVYPGVGGVLIRGQKGTAKSTAARSLAALLPRLRVVEGCPFRCDPALPWPECPHCSTAAECRPTELPVPFIDLPLGATEDRVLGTLDFELALREGRRAFQPGLLASAHRGILYIDEVNLLPDHLVDVLLDAAAMGINTVQREGVSVTHPSRFLLVGTMNPEEGDLRPQLLDRFGLMVEVAAPRDPAVRAEIVRRRLAFESSPEAFAATWASEQAILSEQVAAAARDRLSGVTMSEDFLTIISQLCCELEVDGLRADLALHRTARARAAFLGRTEVNLEDIRAAAELTLPHRRKRQPFEKQPQQHLSPEQLDERLEALQRQQQQENGDREEEKKDDPDPSAKPREEAAAAEQENGTEEEERLFESAPAQVLRRLEVARERATSNGSAAGGGRRNPVPSGERGRTVRAIPDEKATADIALAATIRAAAARRGGAWSEEDGRLQVSPSDLHRKQRAGRTGTLLLFVVDASGSMAARRRMELVKGTVLGLLRSASEQHDLVAVVAFRGARAEVLLPPTSSVEQAEIALHVLPTGGRTPLAHALVVAGDVVRQAQRSHPELPTLLICLSDGRANVPLPDTTGAPWPQALQAAQELASAGVVSLVLDTDAGFIRLGRAQELAQALGATCLPLEDLSAETFALQLRQRKG
jgi:magnesium chelatase subunit D